MSAPTLDLGEPGWALRAWREGHAAALALHANEPGVWRHMSDGFPHPCTLQIAEHWVRRGQLDFGGVNGAVVLDDAVVGGCGLHPGSNPASMRLLEHCGFVNEGLQRLSVLKAGVPALPTLEP